MVSLIYSHVIHIFIWIFLILNKQNCFCVWRHCLSEKSGMYHPVWKGDMYCVVCYEYPGVKLEKMWFFWRKIVVFNTKYPNNFFKSAPFNLKSWIRHWYRIYFRSTINLNIINFRHPFIYFIIKILLPI